MTMTETDRYANGRKRKVYQRSTVLAIFEIPRDISRAAFKNHIESNSSLKVSRIHEWPSPKYPTTVTADVSYEAVGANRCDIEPVLARLFGEQLKHVSGGKTEAL